MPRHGTAGVQHGRSTESWKRVHEMPADSDRVRDGCAAFRSEFMMRGAGCGKPARPDLWGPWAGNRPGLPDPSFFCR